MFSGVRRLASSYMKNPVTVFVGTLDLVLFKKDIISR